jgi:hypothetical protein
LGSGRTVRHRLAFYRETILLDSPDSDTRAWDYPVAELLKAFEDQDCITGHGIGPPSLGTQYVARIMEAPQNEMGVKSGYRALVLWLVWTSSLMVAVLRVFGAHFTYFRTYGGMQGYQDFMLNAYLWLLIGTLFRLPALVARDNNSVPGEKA